MLLELQRCLTCRRCTQIKDDISSYAVVHLCSAHQAHMQCTINYMATYVQQLVAGLGLPALLFVCGLLDAPACQLMSCTKPSLH